MTKHFCDRCESEIVEQHHPMRYSRMRHISRGVMAAHSKLIDGEWHNFSGADDSAALCLPCYNEVMYAAEAEFRKPAQHIARKSNKA